jgi:hypothetical protein
MDDDDPLEHGAFGEFDALDALGRNRYFFPVKANQRLRMPKPFQHACAYKFRHLTLIVSLADLSPVTEMDAKLRR